MNLSTRLDLGRTIHVCFEFAFDFEGLLDNSEMSTVGTRKRRKRGFEAVGVVVKEPKGKAVP